MKSSSETVPSTKTFSATVEESLMLSFKLHLIIFSLLFFIIGCYSLVVLIKTVCRAPQLSRNYRLAVYALLVTLCFSRTLYLILNPYETGEGLVPDTPLVVLKLMYSLGEPSLTAAFGLVHASFLKISEIRRYGEGSILKTRTILSVIGVYFTFAIVAVVTTVYHPSLNPMLAVSCCLAVITCTIVVSTISYSGIRILRIASKNKKVLSMGKLPGAASTKQLMKTKSVSKVGKITLAASTFCGGITIANVVALAVMLRKMPGLSGLGNPRRLFVFMSCVRLLEIAMAATLIYALSRNIRESTKSFLSRLSTNKSSRQPLPLKNTWSNGVSSSSNWLSSSLSSLTKLENNPRV